MTSIHFIDVPGDGEKHNVGLVSYTTEEMGEGADPQISISITPNHEYKDTPYETILDLEIPMAKTLASALLSLIQEIEKRQI